MSNEFSFAPAATSDSRHGFSTFPGLAWTGSSLTVYADDDDKERRVRIVGVDEVGHEPGEISWISPVARALLKAREGDVVNIRTPAGLESIEVVEISYDDA